eukprot:9759821-Alexandrium_andersonii.AAC.1
MRGPRDASKSAREAPDGCIRAIPRADPGSDDDKGGRGRPRSGKRKRRRSNPQSANPQSVPSFALDGR